MFSSGTRIAILMLVLLVAGTAAYWVFLADPGPDPLAPPEDDPIFVDAGPDDPDAPDVPSITLGSGDGFGARPAEPIGVDDEVAGDAAADDARRAQAELERNALELAPLDEPSESVVRPWETMRRVAAGGPIRVVGDEPRANRTRPSLGEDAHDPDAGKGADAYDAPLPSPPSERSPAGGAGASSGTATPEPPAAVPAPTPAPIPTPTPIGGPTPPATSTATGWGEHIVSAGDTVVAIAELWFGEPGQWDLIIRANPGLDPTRMAVGQRLRLPPRTWRPAPDAPAPTGERVHEVRPGETLSVIARAQYGRVELWRLIYDANRETIGADPGRLKVGMRLRIPPAPAER